MGEYKGLKIVNAGLSEQEWDAAYQNVNKYDIFIRKGNIMFLFGGRSTTKRVYSIDAGATTTEYNAMKLAVRHYLGDFARRVTIIETE